MQGHYEFSLSVNSVNEAIETWRAGLVAAVGSFYHFFYEVITVIISLCFGPLSAELGA